MTNQNHNYPTRMHEVLGVETGERFKIEKLPDEFFLNHEGRMTVVTAGRMFNSSGDILTYAINHGITRRPRLTKEQVKKLHAALLLGFKWLTVNSIDELWLFGTKPRKFNLGWGESIAAAARIESEDNSDLSRLVSWSDPEPLDIVATLKAAGVGNTDKTVV